MVDVIPFPAHAVRLTARQLRDRAAGAFVLASGAVGYTGLTTIRPAPSAAGPAEDDRLRHADRVADVVMAIEATRSIDFNLSVDREPGDAEATLTLRVSNGLWQLNAVEALDVAAALRADAAFAACDRIAEIFEARAAEARELDELAARPFTPAPTRKPTLTIGGPRIPWPAVKVVAVWIGLFAIGWMVLTGAGR